MPITFDAGAIRFGAISPGKSAIQTVTSSEAPADAKVIAIITGDDASSFNINTLSSYEWILEDVGSGDLPHGFHGHPKEQVLELAGQTDGKTSLSVSEGQIVKVEVVATSPTVGNKANLSALLLIQGNSWGPPIGIRFSMFRGHVDIVPESDFIRFQISQGFLNLTLRLVTPDTPTHVVFEPAGWRTDVNVTIAGQNSRPIGPGTHESPITLGFDTGPANPSSSGYFHLAATAFIDSDNKQRELLVFRMVQPRNISSRHFESKEHRGAAVLDRYLQQPANSERWARKQGRF